MGNTQEDGFTHESRWGGSGSPAVPEESWDICCELGPILCTWWTVRPCYFVMSWSGVGMCRDHQELLQDFPGFSSESPAFQEAAQSLATPMSLFHDIAWFCFGGWDSSHSDREDPHPQGFNTLILSGEDIWIPSCINQKIYKQYWEVNINTLPSRFSDGETEALLY